MEFFKSEKQRISYRDAGVVFLLLFVIIVMTFEDATSGMPHSEKLQEDILPIIAITLGAIAAILFVKAKNEIYYLQNALQNLGSWHRDPLGRIEDFSPAIYGSERDIARSVVLYAMLSKDAPDPSTATGREPYYRHTAVAKINIRKVAARGLDLHGRWRQMYLRLRELEKRFLEEFPGTDEADPQRLYHLRSLLLYLFALGGTALLQRDFWDLRLTGDYLRSADGFPDLSDEEREAVSAFYRRLAAGTGSSAGQGNAEEGQAPATGQSELPEQDDLRRQLLKSAAGVPSARQ